MTGWFGGGDRVAPVQGQQSLAPLPVAPSRRSVQETADLAADQRRRYFGRTTTPSANGAAPPAAVSSAVRFLGGAAKT